ncbi:MAG: hypothetical protein IID44_15565 [Planctomycetes bacterium]|nr:hypothetical protein [Planctomycetota bacterium]
MGYLDHTASFPHLTSANSAKKSDETKSYNCIAWAAGDTANWWWPIVGRYWPPGVPREVTLDAFIQAFATVGYSPCADGAFIDGTEKIAIYADLGEPTHAARQREYEKWTSKIGKLEDIDHDTLQDVGGPLYGEAVVFMERPRADS